MSNPKMIKPIEKNKNLDANIFRKKYSYLSKLKELEKEYIQTSMLSRIKIFLKRQSNEVAINAYNKTILTLLESNMDIQFVLDPYSCASYVINYVTKVAGLSHLLKEAAKDLNNDNLTIKEKF